MTFKTNNEPCQDLWARVPIHCCWADLKEALQMNYKVYHSKKFLGRVMNLTEDSVILYKLESNNFLTFPPLGLLGNYQQILKISKEDFTEFHKKGILTIEKSELAKKEEEENKMEGLSVGAYLYNKHNTSLGAIQVNAKNYYEIRLWNFTLISNPIKDYILREGSQLYEDATYKIPKDTVHNLIESGDVLTEPKREDYEVPAEKPLNMDVLESLINIPDIPKPAADQCIDRLTRKPKKETFYIVYLNYNLAPEECTESFTGTLEELVEVLEEKHDSLELADILVFTTPPRAFKTTLADCSVEEFKS